MRSLLDVDGASTTTTSTIGPPRKKQGHQGQSREMRSLLDVDGASSEHAGLSANTSRVTSVFSGNNSSAASCAYEEVMSTRSSQVERRLLSVTSDDDSDFCLPLPYSKIPLVQKPLYGRSAEMETIQRRLSQGASITAVQGVGGIGKSHLVAHACKKWVAQDPFSRFVIWVNAATDYTLRVSYLDALQQVLMGHVRNKNNNSNHKTANIGISTSASVDNSTLGSGASNQGEIVIVAELLHRQLRRQRRKEQAKQALLKGKRKDRDHDDDEEEDTTQVFSEDTDDCADENAHNYDNENDEIDDKVDYADSIDDSQEERMDTPALAHLLWDSLLQGISQEYEWVLVYQNLPGGMGGVQGPNGIQPFFLPISEVPTEEWSQGRIVCTTRHSCFSGSTALGEIFSFRVDRMDEESALRMLLAQAVFDAGHPVGAKNLESPRKLEILKDAEKIGRKLVGPHYLNGSPLLVSTAIGHIVSSGITLRDYYSNLKQQVAMALEASGYGSGKVQSSVKRETSIAVCLEQAIGNAHSQGLADILSAAAFSCADNIPIKLLGGATERVKKLVSMNLLTKVGIEMFSMHRVHQRTAVDAVLTYIDDSRDMPDTAGDEDEFLCTPDHAVLNLRSALSNFSADQASSWRSARIYVPHVEALRVHYDLLERKKQLSPNFNHAYYAEIIDTCASVLQWAMKDRLAAFVMFQEALRLRRGMFSLVSASSEYSSNDSSSNMKSDLAAGLSRTLTSLGSLAEKDEDAQKYFREALDIVTQTVGESSASVEVMALYVALADVEARLQRNVVAYDLYKKALEFYFTIYGHNQNIYADDQKMFLAETLQKIGTLAHCQMKRHAEAELYLEGTLSLLRHVGDEEAETKRDEMANALETLGSICHAQNRMREAKQYYKSALHMKTRILGDKNLTGMSPSLSYDSSDSDVTADGAAGDLEQPFFANTLHNSNQEYAVELVPVDSVVRARASASRDIKLAKTLHRLGVMAWNLGSLKQAEDYFEKALSLQNSGYGMDAMNEDIAITLFSLGGLCNDLRNDQVKACEYYERALGCYYQIHGKKAQNESIAQLLHALGQSSQMLNMPQKARTYLKQVCMQAVPFKFLD